MRVSSPQLSACRSSSILSRIGIPYCPISAIEGFAERDLSRRPGRTSPMSKPPGLPKTPSVKVICCGRTRKAMVEALIELFPRKEEGHLDLR
jgi:hypothetical protein